MRAGTKAAPRRTLERLRGAAVTRQCCVSSTSGMSVRHPRTRLATFELEAAEVSGAAVLAGGCEVAAWT